MNLPLKRITDLAAVAQVLRDWKSQLEAALALALLGGRVLPAVAFETAGAVVYVEHGLQRAPQGWLVLRLKAAATTLVPSPVAVLREPAETTVTAADAKRLPLVASAVCTADLLVW